ncbi:peptidoglycan-binding protein [bacterium]|jgi:hypothetical protein|nr:peptidoglycan-binding protein [bacterium]
MKINKTLLLSFFSILSFLISVPLAFAATPTLSISGNGDTVTMTVNGDANATVLMYYTKTGVGPTLHSIGTTNSSGYLSVGVSTSTLAVASASAVHVTVNSQSSSDVAWPTYSSTSGTITLSQTGLVLNVGSSSTITASGSNSLYLSNNTNSAIANVGISGSSITITGNTYGSTVVTICPQGSSTNCPSVYVTVQNSGTTPLTFSQNNLTIAYNQSVPVTVSGGTGFYTILSNSNSNNVSASLSSSTVTVRALQSSGQSSITVCSSDISSCGIINITVGATSSATLYFSQTNPTVSIGQTTTISISGGGSSSYYLSSNSNNSVVQATVSGTTLSLYGILSGSSTITVCSSAGSCNSLGISVSYVSSGGSLTLSQSSVSLLVGQSVGITISGGATPYSISSGSGNIFQSSLNGNIITLSGITIGSSTLLVCSSESACVNLSVAVNSSSSSTSNPTFSQNNLSLILGQSQSVTVSGNGGYYVSGNTSSSVASATINGTVITINSLSLGNTNISICQNGGLCSVLYVTVLSSASTTTTTAATSFLTFSNKAPSLSVGQGSVITISGGSGYTVAYNSSSSVAQTAITGSSLILSGIKKGCAVVVICSSNNTCGALLVSVGITSSTTTTTTGHQFTSNLTYGDLGDEVSALQQRLKSEGYYSGSITGYYGSLTTAAVRSYQKAKGINQTGTMGPQTMAALNK